jgi:hypothetical protein
MKYHSDIQFSVYMNKFFLIYYFMETTNPMPPAGNGVPGPLLCLYQNHGRF